MPERKQGSSYMLPFYDTPPAEFRKGCGHCHFPQQDAWIDFDGIYVSEVLPAMYGFLPTLLRLQGVVCLRLYKSRIKFQTSGLLATETSIQTPCFLFP